MNQIEVIIVLLLLFMAVPDVCRKLGRPALAYAAFVMFGVLLGPMASPSVAGVLWQAGQVGFVLLLFEVGLEIDIPRLRDFLRPLFFALPWALIQYPVVLALGHFAGLDLVESFIAAAALTGCSVGMAHTAWKHYPGLDENTRRFAIRVLVSLEMLAIVLLALETPMLAKGATWLLPLKLAGIATVVFLVGRFSVHLTRLFQRVLEMATRWRTHMVVLLVLVVCAAGERLGLSGAKTAFFLGLFMSRAEHDGKGLHEYTAPVSERFLIPIFFVSVGMSVQWKMFASWTALLALGTAGLLLGMRQVLHRRWPILGGDRETFLLLCPNLTVVALGALALLGQSGDRLTQSSWLLLTGLFMTVLSLGAMQGSPEVRGREPRPAVDDEEGGGSSSASRTDGKEPPNPAGARGKPDQLPSGSFSAEKSN